MASSSEELASTFAERISSLAPEAVEGRIEPTEQRLVEFESHIGAKLPVDYRVFLAKHAAIKISATCPILEPSPCGQEAIVETIYGFLDADHYGSLAEVSDDADGAPVVIPIAEGGFGSQMFLILNGELSGSVYFFDAQQRYFWPDEQFHSMYENLHPDIAEYLRRRAENELPAKPAGMENFYLVSESFTEFVMSMAFWDLDADDDEDE